MAISRFLGLTTNQLAEMASNLEDENATLRELLTIASDMARDYDGDRRLLRELVRDMWRSAVMRMDFAERYAFIDEFIDRMRVLGVGVEVNK